VSIHPACARLGRTHPSKGEIDMSEDSLLKVEVLDDEEFAERYPELSADYSDTCCYNFLVVTYNDEVIFTEMDYYEPENCQFWRDLAFVPKMFKKLYALGVEDGKKLAKQELDN